MELCLDEVCPLGVAGVGRCEMDIVGISKDVCVSACGCSAPSISCPV